jgi:hypothetical protein
LVEGWQFGGNDFVRWFLAGKNLSTEFSKFQIGFARDNVISELDDQLRFDFVADLGSAENDGDVRPKAFDGGDDFGCRRDVPNVNAEADYFRVSGEKDFNDVGRALVDIEFEQARRGLQWAEIGKEIPQAERGVDVFGVECRQDNIGHMSNR